MGQQRKQLSKKSQLVLKQVTLLQVRPNRSSLFAKMYSNSFCEIIWIVLAVLLLCSILFVDCHIITDQQSLAHKCVLLFARMC